MNRKILQKVIDALNIGTPDKVMYAIGALDSLMEGLPEEHTGLLGLAKPIVVEAVKSDIDDEAKALEYMAKAKIEAVRLMSGDTND